jgi:hypothetical protein
MIPPLVLSPKLQRRQREAAHYPRGPLPNGGLTGDVGSRPPQAFRASGEARELPAVSPLPIPYDRWTRVGSTLFYHFKDAPKNPEDLLDWARGPIVAQEQGRGTRSPCYVIAVLPASKPFFDYSSVMEQVNDMGIGVAHAASPGLRLAWDGAQIAKERDRRRAAARAGQTTSHPVAV